MCGHLSVWEQFSPWWQIRRTAASAPSAHSTSDFCLPSSFLSFLDLLATLPDLFLLPVPQAPSVTGQPGPGHGKKLGHRGVDASGETTYKKVAGGPSWVAREVGTVADWKALQVTRCCGLPTMAVATYTVR